MKVDLPRTPIAPALSTTATGSRKLRCDSCPGRNLGLCAPLDDPRLAQLLALGGARRWNRGEPVFTAGEPMKQFYKITRGIVAVFRSFDDGRRQIVSINTVGDSCGYLEKDGKYHFSGEAITDVEACGFDRRRFDVFAARHPDLAAAVANELSFRLARTGDTLAALGQLRAPEKVAFFLLQIAHIYAENLDASSSPLELQLTRRQIADYLGLTLETVSRSFAKLKAKELVALIGSDSIVVLDKPRLAQFASLEVI